MPDTVAATNATTESQRYGNARAVSDEDRPTSYEPRSTSRASCLQDIDCVVLAGGKGTRLGALFPDTPKLLVPLMGRPFLEHLLDRLRRHGARRVVLALGHLGARVEEYLKARGKDGIEIVTSVEPKPMDTGGGLRWAFPVLRSDPILAMNGDSLTEENLCRLVEAHHRFRAEATLLVSDVTHSDRYGMIDVSTDGRVKGFVEKTQGGKAMVNAGVYVFGRRAVESIAAGRPVSLEREWFPSMVGKGLYAVVAEQPFLDVGTPESYHQANLHMGGGAKV